MPKKNKEKKRRLQKSKFEKEQQRLDHFRKVRSPVKAALRKVGCDLPFYDFLDSYANEFEQIVASAIAEHPSILAIHEVDNRQYLNPDWAKLGVNGLNQVMFTVDERFAGYVKATKTRDGKANIQGSTTFFGDGSNLFRSVVLIPRKPDVGLEHPEYRYAFKIGALFHEIGHVQDAENSVNIDPLNNKFDVIHAEAFAHCYALDRLAERCLVKTYEMMYGAIETMRERRGYEAEIAKLVLEQHQRRELPNWLDYMDHLDEVA